MALNEPYEKNELLRRIAGSDENAMSQVFSDYFGKLVNYACQLIKDRAEAEDIAMRALGKLWQKSRDGEKIDVLDGFLYRTVHNQCIDIIRHEKIKGKQRAEGPGSGMLSENYIESNYILAELVGIIYEEMNRLPDKCGEVVKLYFIHGLSHREIAEKMNIEEKTVRNQKARALSLLRTILIKKNLLHLFLCFF